MKFSCILIGENNLLIHCGSLLLEMEHQIKWVVTPTKSVQAWCDKNKLAWVTSINDLNDENQVDYIFSIVNGTILTSGFISRARYAAINYHDSLLPRYAGVHATNWAIINGEKEHGITWHIINEGIDEGDIVYQASFAINVSDRALNLNLRSFEEAIKGFSKIIKMIENNDLKRIPQSLGSRSYYGKTHPLENLGFINWRDATAISIDRHCRGLNVGSYDNNLGTLKLYLDNDFLIVLDLDLLNLANLPKQSGLVLDISPKGLLISTNTKPVLLKKLLNSQGQEVKITDLIHKYDLARGRQLPLVNEVLLKKIALYSNALKYETFWLEKFDNIVEHLIFTPRLFAKKEPYTELNPVTINNSTFEKFPSATYLISAILIYLYRINNYEHATVFLNYPLLDDENVLFSDYLPYTPDFSSEESCNTVMQGLNDSFLKLRSYGTFLKDIFVRHPTIKRADKIITINVVDNLQCAEKYIPENSMLHFRIDSQKGEILVQHRIDTNYQNGVIAPLIKNLGQHLTNILNNLITSPEQLVHQFSFITLEERKKIMAASIGDFIALPCQN